MQNFVFESRIKIELERLTNLGLLTPVDEHTDWVSNMVVVTKASGQLRICIDSQHLNRALK